MKILFIYAHNKPEFWLDGLYGALQELARTNSVDFYNIFENKGEFRLENYDFVLGWGAFGSPADEYIRRNRLKIGKCGLCIAGNTTRPFQAEKYDVLFYETNWVKEYLELATVGVPLVKAFGINTNIFNRIEYATPIVYDYLGVGAFATWKRWDKFNSKKGMRLVVGEFQKNNQAESSTIVKDLMLNGTGVMPMVHPFDLANLYHWSRTVYIPADVFGGGERAVMEAISCGCSVEIEEDNPKLAEIVATGVVDHIEYAKQLEKGIKLCVS